MGKDSERRKKDCVRVETGKDGLVDFSPGMMYVMKKLGACSGAVTPAAIAGCDILDSGLGTGWFSTARFRKIIPSSACWTFGCCENQPLR